MARHTCHRKRAIASGLGDRKSQAKKQAICVTSDDAPDLPEVEGPPSPAEALPQLDPRLDHPVHAAPPPGEAGVGDIRPPARSDYHGKKGKFSDVAISLPDGTEWYVSPSFTTQSASP